MNNNQAIEFLKNHQPMPPTKSTTPEDSDSLCPDELMMEYDSVRKYFMEHPDEKAIPLFLNSFSFGDGYGVYQLVEDYLWLFPKETVTPYLVEAVASQSDSVQYWAVLFSSSYINDSYVLRDKIVELLEHGTSEVKEACIVTLALLESSGDAISIFHNRLSNEQDIEIKQMLIDMICELKA